MRRLFHLGMSSRDVVICRNVEDYNTATNCLALSAFSTDSSILADSVMSNHLHADVETENLDKFALGFRLRYSKYFNRKYGAKAFPTLSCFSLELLGQNHITVALNYVLRNGLHHGQCATAFGYPFSSVNSYFREELGRSDLEYGEIITDRSEMAGFLPRHSEFPDSWVMSRSWLFLRSSFEDIKRVENIYVSPRSFLYNMNRITGSSLVAEQLKDENGAAPITLDLIESCDGKSMTEMLNNEYGKVCDYRKTQHGCHKSSTSCATSPAKQQSGSVASPLRVREQRRGKLPATSSGRLWLEFSPAAVARRRPASPAAAPEASF